jgi:hypothetical protein
VNSEQHDKQKAQKAGIDRGIVVVVIVITGLVVLGVTYTVFKGPSNRIQDDSNTFKRPTNQRAAPGSRRQPFNPLSNGK